MYCIIKINISSVIELLKILIDFIKKIKFIHHDFIIYLRVASKFIIDRLPALLANTALVATKVHDFLEEQMEIDCEEMCLDMILLVTPSHFV